MAGFAITVFLGGFLVFQVQPLMGRYIVPWFGGGSSVWTACLLFFQVGLLAGYAYAHLLAARLRPRTQGWLHLALLAATLAVLPIGPGTHWKPTPGSQPTTQILILLLINVGGPYIALSSTGPLMQSWFARSHPGRSPYRLYALSNAASLLALISYPILIEPVLPLARQAAAWSWMYALFALAAGWGAVGMIMSDSGAGGAAAASASPRTDPPPPTDPPDPLSLRTVVLWLALAAAGSAMLLATTNQLCQEVASVPFLWVVPLAVYLLTFIICFDHERWYDRRVFAPLLAIMAPLAIVALISGTSMPFWLQVAVYSGVLFACCMVCHGELVRARPGPRHLTLFYLMVAAGGALGGAGVALVAPVVFTGYWEFHVSLAACCLLAVYAAVNDPRTKPVARELARGYALVAAVLVLAGFFALTSTYTPWFTLAPRSAEEIRVGFATLIEDGWAYVLLAVWCTIGLTVAASIDLLRAREGEPPAWYRSALYAAALGIAIALYFQRGTADVDAIYAERNFYGVLRIVERSDTLGRYRTLVNGRIAHGRQYLDAVNRLRPVTYYDPRSGVGLAITNHPHRFAKDSAQRALRVGVIGLGAGTLAAFGRPGDTFRFYEINPAVVALSHDYFWYLKDSRAHVDVVVGDARIALESEVQRGDMDRLDVLAVDAFTSDAIPAHLLTEECTQVYLRRLADDGLLLLHISNRFVSLEPVARGLAQHFGLQMVTIHTISDALTGTSTSSWVILAKPDNPIFGVEDIAAALNADPLVWEPEKVAAARLHISGAEIERRISTGQLATKTKGDERLVQFNPDPPPMLWTDDFSSLWSAMKFR